MVLDTFKLKQKNKLLASLIYLLYYVFILTSFSTEDFMSSLLLNFMLLKVHNYLTYYIQLSQTIDIYFSNLLVINDNVNVKPDATKMKE